MHYTCLLQFRNPRGIFVITFQLISTLIAHHRGAIIKHLIGKYQTYLCDKITGFSASAATLK